MFYLFDQKNPCIEHVGQSPDNLEKRRGNLFWIHSPCTTERGHKRGRITFQTLLIPGVTENDTKRRDTEKSQRRDFCLIAGD